MQIRNLYTFKFFFLVISSIQSYASGGSIVYNLDDRQYSYFDPKLWDHIEYLEDTGGMFRAEQILNKTFSSFDVYQNKKYDNNSIHWFRIKLKNNSETNSNWFAEFPYPQTEIIRMFLWNDNYLYPLGSYSSSTPFQLRKVKHKNYIFPFSIRPTGTSLLFFSVKNKDKLRIRLTVRPAISFFNYALNEYYLLGIYYGILLIMVLYNLLIFLSVREVIYLYYIFYVVSYCLHSLKVDGLGSQFIWKSFPAINYYNIHYSGLLLVLAFTIYCIKFLSLNNHFPKFTKFIYVNLGVYLLLFIWNEFVLPVFWINYFYLLLFVLLYLGAFLSYKKNNSTTKLFFIAFSFLVMAFTIFTLRNYYLLPTNIFTIYVLNFGFLVEVVLFSYAIGKRVKEEREEKIKSNQLLIGQLQENEKLKDNLNRSLELKVAERTREVELKNEELKIALRESQQKSDQIASLNKLLQRDNQLLEENNESLHNNIKEINKARVLLKDLTFEEFKKVYPDEQACLQYLSEIKWTTGYQCKKCNNGAYYPGKTLFSRRCTKCDYDESVTSFSIFHNSKMSVLTSFYLTYLVVSNKQISSHQLSDILGLRQKTCWAYKKKIEEKIGLKPGKKWQSKDWGKIFYA